METENNIKELIESFQKQVDGFKEQLDKQLSSTEIDELRKELVEKKKLIATLIDNLKPLEEEISGKNSLIESLGGKLEEYALEVQKLKKGSDANHIRLEKFNLVLDNKKIESQRLIEENNYLKKEIFKEKNKLAAIEAKTFQTDDKNQKLANELIHARQQLKELENNSSIEITSLQGEVETSSIELRNYKTEEEAKRERLMELHAKKIAITNAQVANLRAQLKQTTTEMSARTEKEKQLITDFSSRLRDITAPTTGPVAMEEEEEFLPHADFYDRATADFIDYQESKVEEIKPMAEIALQQGESEEKVKRSLRSSGYKKEDIEEVFESIKLNQ